MSLRLKIFLPLFVFALVFLLFISYYWAPRYLQNVVQEHHSHLVAHLNSVGEGLVPMLLEDQLANIHDNLSSLENKNRNWRSLTLVSEDGKLLYPLEEKNTLLGLSSSSVKIIEQKISYLDYPLGKIRLIYDTREDLENLSQTKTQLLQALVALLLAYLLGSYLILEEIVRQPITDLARASREIVKGNFNHPLPKQHNDEVGYLIDNFSRMRDAIQHFQNDLKEEMESHKQTAEELFYEKERVSYHASHDMLTDLVNRREFEERLDMAVADARHTRRQHALLYMDLDQFKLVNDTCGHIAGDALLKQLANTLRHYVREGDTLARLGGDEFGLLLENCPIEKAEEIAGKLRDSVQEIRFSWENNIFNIGISIGVVPISEHTENTAELTGAADSACYAAKDAGRNRVHVYLPEDTDLARRKGEMQWVMRLNRAMEEDHFLLYAQPIIKNIAHGMEVEQYEVLLRLQEDNGEMVLPGVFIPAAERYGLMQQIDRWVITRVMTVLAELKTQHPDIELPKFSINISGASLGDESLLQFIRDEIERLQPPTSLLCLEITETAAIADIRRAHELISALREHSIEFSLDDFGSGLSSYAYLKYLPVDYLKIDGLFVRDILQDPVDLALVRSINEIGHIMNMRTIAEFVENDGIRACLHEISVDMLQGFGIMKPEALDSVIAKLIGNAVGKRQSHA